MAADWGSLQRSPRSPSWFQLGPLCGRRGMEGRTRGEGREGKEGMGKGGEKGEVGGIAPWLLGDRRP